MGRKKFYCPVNGWDCPYWHEDGTCKLVNEGKEKIRLSNVTMPDFFMRKARIISSTNEEKQ